MVLLLRESCGERPPVFVCLSPSFKAWSWSLLLFQLVWLNCGAGFCDNNLQMAPVIPTSWDPTPVWSPPRESL